MGLVTRNSEDRIKRFSLVSPKRINRDLQIARYKTSRRKLRQINIIFCENSLLISEDAILDGRKFLSPFLGKKKFSNLILRLNASLSDSPIEQDQKRSHPVRDDPILRTIQL